MRRGETLGSHTNDRQSLFTDLLVREFAAMAIEMLSARHLEVDVGPRRKEIIYLGMIHDLLSELGR
jgi:hypothetical protein